MKTEISNKKREKIIELIKLGVSSGEISEELGVGKMQVAGIKAHLTLRDRKVQRPLISEAADGVPPPWSNTPPPKDLTPATEKTSILIGTDQVFAKKVYWNFDPETGSVNPHVLIVGETGFGKTYAAQCMVAELKKKRITSVIFDYGQGFGVEDSSRDFIALTEPSQIEVSKDGVAINPLQIFPDDIMGPVNAAQRTADTFCRIYPNMGIQQKESIIEAIEHAFSSANIFAKDRASWKKPLPEFDQVHRMLRHIADSKDHPLKSHARTAYSHIRSFFRFNLVRNEGEEITWNNITYGGGAVWIFQLRGLDHYVSMVLTEMLLWNLVSYLQSSGAAKIRLIVVLDEAHKLSFERDTPVDWMLREGRKYGLGVILASQHLADYSQLAVANTATKIVFQNDDNRYGLSKPLARKCKNILDFGHISGIIATLKKGTAFFLSENVGRIVSIDDLRSRR